MFRVVRVAIPLFTERGHERRGHPRGSGAGTGLGRDVQPRLSESLLANAQLIRITLRDLDARPELAGRIAEDMLAALHRAMAKWLAGQVEAGTLRPHDTAAIAAVLFSAISYYRVVDILLGKPPAEIKDERLIGALVDPVDPVGQGLIATRATNV